MEISKENLTISVMMLPFLLGLFILMKPRKRAAPLPPGPRGLPIVGYLPFLGNNMLKVFTELAPWYGPIYKLKVGSRLWVIVSSPSIAQEVARDQDTIFANHFSTVAQEIFSHGCNDVSFSPYGSNWRHKRKIFVGEVLSKSSLDATYDLRKSEVRNSIKSVTSKNGTPVDIGELLLLTIAKANLNMLLGCTIKDDEKSQVVDEIRKLLKKIIDLMFTRNYSDFFPDIARFDLQGIGKDTAAAIKSLEGILDTLMQRGMERSSAKEGHECKEGNTKKDFIQILLELGEQEETSKRISMAHIKCISSELVFGSDTISSAAEGLLNVLMHNSEVIQKIQKELDDVVGVNNIVEEFHLPKLKYLNAVVMEGLRLHPPLPYLIPRFPSQSCTLAGYTIPKGTQIFVNIFAIQRDPQNWENPLDFHPERFLNEPDKWDLRGNNFQYLPFGSGRRMCAGLTIAMRMLMYPLASLLHSFDWQAIETKSLLAIPTKRLPNSDLYT